ncbi:MAG: DUF4974 domain-containing protein, partial [Chitinophagaceae bacterium]
LEHIGLLMDGFWKDSQERELGQEKAGLILQKVFDQGPTPTNNGRVGSFKWMGWAAAILLVSVSILVYYTNSGRNVSMISSSVVSNPAANGELMTVSTTTEHQRVMLPDGSVVILNRNSSITYPKTFSSQRSVELKGEGYFDIKHDEHSRFTVTANKIKTVVLGTAFNIKAYDADQDIEVTVTRGKVGIQDQDKTLAILVPNQQIVYNKTASKSSMKTVVARKTVLWQQSDIFFDDVSMEEAVSVLAKKFGTSIVFSNEGSKKCRFSATFLKGESLPEILKVICSFNNAQYQNSPGGITISGEGCE